MVNRAPLKTLSLAAACVLALAGCERQNSVRINFQMGDRVVAGPVTYNVIQTTWRTQLGELFNIRLPKNRYMLITLSATNGGGKDVSLPFFALINDKGQEFREIEDGTGVDNWFGFLRTIEPAETRQGNLLFDVPLTSYRLRLTDGNEPGTERTVWVQIPLRIDTDTSISIPIPEQR